MQTAASNQTKRIIWIALLVSQAVYVAIGLLHPGLTGTSLGENRILSLALAVVSVATAGVAHLFWRRAAGVNLPLHAILERDPTQSFIFFIQAWVFDESIAVYGLVQALLGIPPAIWLPFSVAGAVLLLLHRPVDPAA